jgi:[ribosomal protein S18]-alanine N-acetyltransferase
MPGPPPAPPPIAITEFTGRQSPSKSNFPCDELAALEKRAFSRADAWTGADLAAAAAKPNALFIVGGETTAAAATGPSTLLGYLAGTSTGSAVHIARVAVQPGARRRGVASRLVAAALRPDKALTRRRRPLAATLHVDPANAPARALYAKLGFVEDARLESYYAPGRDAVRMVKNEMDGG